MKKDWLNNIEGGAEHNNAEKVESVAHIDKTLAVQTQVIDTFDRTMESTEDMGAQMNGTIKTMRIIGNNGIWSITPTDWGEDIFFSSYTFVGRLPEFKIIFDWKEKGEKFDVTFNIHNTPNGPIAINVSVVK